MVYKVCKTLKEIEETTKILLDSKVLSFDVETTSLDFLKSEIICLSFSNKPGYAYVIPYRYPNLF